MEALYKSAIERMIAILEVAAEDDKIRHDIVESVIELGKWALDQEEGQ